MKVTILLSTLFNTIRGEARKQEQGVMQNVRDVVVVIGNSELGIAPPASFDLRAVGEVTKRSGLSEADLRASIDEYRKRCEWAKLETQLESLQAAAREAEQAQNAADEAECIRRQKAHQELQRLAVEALRKQQAYERAQAAHIELMATAVVSDEERELSVELAKLIEQARELRFALDPNGRNPNGFGLATMCEKQPAVAERECLQSLKEIDAPPTAVNKSAERKNSLKKTLTVARRHKRECEQKLAAIEKQRAEINEKLAAFAADKLKPESFQLKRARPTTDELQKRHAAKFGCAKNDPGYALRTG